MGPQGLQEGGRSPFVLHRRSFDGETAGSVPLLTGLMLLLSRGAPGTAVAGPIESQTSGQDSMLDPSPTGAAHGEAAAAAGGEPGVVVVLDSDEELDVPLAQRLLHKPPAAAGAAAAARPTLATRPPLPSDLAAGAGSAAKKRGRKPGATKSRPGGVAAAGAAGGGGGLHRHLVPRDQLPPPEVLCPRVAPPPLIASGPRAAPVPALPTAEEDWVDPWDDGLPLASPTGAPAEAAGGRVAGQRGWLAVEGDEEAAAGDKEEEEEELDRPLILRVQGSLRQPPEQQLEQAREEKAVEPMSAGIGITPPRLAAVDLVGLDDDAPEWNPEEESPALAAAVAAPKARPPSHLRGVQGPEDTEDEDGGVDFDAIPDLFGFLPASRRLGAPPRLALRRAQAAAAAAPSRSPSPMPAPAELPAKPSQGAAARAPAGAAAPAAQEGRVRSRSRSARPAWALEDSESDSDFAAPKRRRSSTTPPTAKGPLPQRNSLHSTQKLQQQQPTPQASPQEQEQQRQPSPLVQQRQPSPHPPQQAAQLPLQAREATPPLSQQPLLQRVNRLALKRPPGPQAPPQQPAAATQAAAAKPAAIESTIVIDDSSSDDEMCRDGTGVPPPAATQAAPAEQRQPEVVLLGSNPEGQSPIAASAHSRPGAPTPAPPPAKSDRELMPPPSRALSHHRTPASRPASAARPPHQSSFGSPIQMADLGEPPAAAAAASARVPWSSGPGPVLPGLRRRRAVVLSEDASPSQRPVLGSLSSEGPVVVPRRYPGTRGPVIETDEENEVDNDDGGPERPTGAGRPTGQAGGHERPAKVRHVALFFFFFRAADPRGLCPLPSSCCGPPGSADQKVRLAVRTARPPCPRSAEGPAGRRRRLFRGRGGRVGRWGCRGRGGGGGRGANEHPGPRLP